MTPTEIREQVLYNIFGEGTPPTSAYNRATALLKEVMRELEDLGQWWWSRRVVGGVIPISTVLTGEDTRTVAGELAELTALVQDQLLLAIENVVIFDKRTTIPFTSGGTDSAAIYAKGSVLTRISYDSPIIGLIAARLFSPELATAITAGTEVIYSQPGTPKHYFFGSDIMALQGSYFCQRVMSYPIPDETTYYAAEVSVRTNLEFDSDDDLDISQNINDRIGLALIAGGTARCAAAFGFKDIAQNFIVEYQTQITRMRMDNARMVSNNLMECEYNDL